MTNYNSYESKICEAIETLIQSSMAKANFDKTIQAKVLSCVDNQTGQYRLRYQDATIYAYSNNLDTSYTSGTMVYVLVPQNDFGKTKTILGTVDSMGVNYKDAISDLDRVNVIGVNTITPVSGKPFQLSSQFNRIYSLYMHDGANNLLSINQNDLYLYFKQAEALVVKGDFKTNIPKEIQLYGKGNFGIIVNVKYKTGIRTYILQLKNMQGTPYNYLVQSTQTTLFKDVKGVDFEYIDKISIFVEGFPGAEDYQQSKRDQYNYNIFISNIQILPATFKTQTELNGYSVKIVTPQGTIFSSQDKANKLLQAVLLYKNIAVNETVNKIEYYWFRENGRVNDKSPSYHLYGGRGWQLIEKNTNTISITEQQITARQVTYKCVAVYKNQIVNSSVIITNTDPNIPIFEIISSVGKNSFSSDAAQISLTCKPSIQKTYSYYWSITDENENTYADDLIDWSTYVVQKRGNQLIKLITSVIERYIYYKCTVYQNDSIYRGTAQFRLVREPQTTMYNLIINNSSSVFQYDESGVSPCSSSKPNPQLIAPLDFILKNNQGVVIPIDSYDYWWALPDNDKSLINISLNTSSVENNQISIPDGYKLYTNLNQITYTISNVYFRNKTLNQIGLFVYYDGMYIQQWTNFLFLKNGDPGTNGTDFVCRIIPKTGGNNTRYYSYPTFYNGKLYFGRLVDIAWPFDVKLYETGRQIDLSGSTITWSLLNEKNSYYKKDGNTIVRNPAVSLLTNSVNILSCRIVKDNKQYYAITPIITQQNCYFDQNSGYTSVVYNSSGKMPSVNAAAPFVVRDGNGTALNGQWSKFGALSSVYTLNNSGTSFVVYPPNDFSDLEGKAAIYFQSGSSYCHIPIYMSFNRYELANINGWDGSALQIDKNGKYILSPQVGAGKKNSDNSFTGVMIGQVGNASSSQTGLFGYGAGKRSVFINAENGNATFGTANGGQIIIEPGSDTAQIKSNNYNTSNNKGGMLIDFAKPEIKFGTGKFSVDENGNLKAENAEIQGAISASSLELTGNAKTDWDTYVNGVQGHLDNIESGLNLSLITHSDFIYDANKNIQVTVDGVNYKYYAFVETTTFTKKTFNSDTQTWAQEKTYDYTTRYYLADDLNNPASNNPTIKTGAKYFTITTVGSGANRKYTIMSSEGLLHANNAIIYGTIVANNGQIGGWTINNDILQNSNKSIIIDPTNGITINSNGKFALTSTNFSVDNTGKITAKDGEIGGWAISSNKLSSGFGETYTGISSLTTDYAFWAGAQNGSSAPFRVGHDGSFTASNATIKGAITATSLTLDQGVTIPNNKVFGLGSLATKDSIDWTSVNNKPNFANIATSGSWNDILNPPTLFSGNYADLIGKPSNVVTGIFTSDSTANGITNKTINVSYADGTSATYNTISAGDFVLTNIGCGDPSNGTYYLLDSNGLLKANNAIINGTIYATAGQVGGWTISNNVLTNNNGIILDPNNGITLGTAGKFIIDSPNFKINQQGYVTIKGADIQGIITSGNSKVLTQNDIYIGVNEPPPSPGLVWIKPLQGGLNKYQYRNTKHINIKQFEPTLELVNGSKNLTGEINYHLRMSFHVNQTWNSTKTVKIYLQGQWIADQVINISSSKTYQFDYYGSFSNPVFANYNSLKLTFEMPGDDNLSGSRNPVIIPGFDNAGLIELSLSTQSGGTSEGWSNTQVKVYL